MQMTALVYTYPTWLTSLALIAVIVAGATLGQVVMHAVIPLGFRNRHNAEIAAIFSIVGVTYAVLLTFVAMLAWEGFNRARAATFEEAGAVAELRRLTLALPAPVADELRGAMDQYVGTVIAVEWPAQTAGHISTAAERWLDSAHIAAGRFQPAGAAEAGVQAAVLAQLATLSAARQGRLLATQPTVPSVVWAVILVGGALVAGFSALLGASSYGLHLVMTGAMCASGALVVVLIVSLDSPFRSDFRISPMAFGMQAAVAGGAVP